MVQQRNPFDQFDTAAGLPAGAQVLIPESPVVRAKDAADLNNAQLSGRRTDQAIGLDAQAAARARAAEARQQTALAGQLYSQGLRIGANGQPEPIPNWVDPKGKAKQATSGPLDALVNQINETERLYRAGPGATSGFEGLRDFLPGIAANSSFDVAANQLEDQAASAFKVPGGGAQTDADAARIARANKPSRSFLDSSNEQLFKGLRARIDAMRAAQGLPAAQWETGPNGQPQQKRDDNIPTIASGGGGTGNPPPPGGPAGYDVAGVAGGVSGGPGGGGNFANAAGVAMATKLKDAYNRGAGVQELNSLLVSNGFQPFADPQAIEAIGKRGPLNFAPPQVDDTRGGFGRAVGGMADNAVGAYAANAVDAATGNNLDSIAGGQTGMALDYANQQSPTASALGTITGGAAAAAGAEVGLGALAARAGIGASPWIARGADALYGAVSGAGMADGPNDSRLTGAALGAAGGLGGGIAGRAAARGIGGALRGVQNADVQGLRAAGVPLTAGQATGGVLKGVEDRLSGIPVIGDVVNARRLEGMQGFNRAAFDEALAPIRGGTGGITGEAGIEAAQSQVSGAYRKALDGVRVQADTPYTQEMLGTFQQARGLPDPMSGRAQYTLNTRVGESFSDGSPLRRTGEDDGWTNYTYEGPNGEIPLSVMPRRQGLEIAIDENNPAGANRLGPRELGEAASYLRSEYPDAKYIYGNRTTGANPGRDQAIDLDRFPIAEPSPGVMTGDGFQQSIRGLRRDAASMANEPYGYDFGQVTGRAEKALEGMLERQSPGTLPAYGQANNAYRQTQVLKDAVNRARNGTRVGETGTFAPSQLSGAAAANAKKFGNSQGTTRQPFFGLSRAGQAVLPNSVPDSGTAGRAVVANGLGLLGLGAGGGYATGDTQTGAGLGLTAAALLAAGGSRGGQRALVSALADRPDALVRLGDQIQRRARIGGLFGAPMLAGAGGYFAGQ